MQKSTTINVSRRAAITSAFIGGMSLLMPRDLIAQELSSPRTDQIDYVARPDLNESQFDIMLRERAESEATAIIERALAKDDRSARAGGRPTYDTVYGSVVNKSTGWHDVAGQPDGGVQISGGGSIFVSPSGGRISQRVSLFARGSREHRRVHSESKTLPQRDRICRQYFRIRILQSDGKRDKQNPTLCCL